MSQHIFLYTQDGKQTVKSNMTDKIRLNMLTDHLVELNSWFAAPAWIILSGKYPLTDPIYMYCSDYNKLITPPFMRTSVLGYSWVEANTTLALVGDALSYGCGKKKRNSGVLYPPIDFEDWYTQIAEILK